MISDKMRGLSLSSNIDDHKMLYLILKDTDCTDEEYFEIWRNTVNSLKISEDFIMLAFLEKEKLWRSNSDGMPIGKRRKKQC